MIQCKKKVCDFLATKTVKIMTQNLTQGLIQDFFQSVATF